jgi:hypothetical protein
MKKIQKTGVREEYSDFLALVIGLERTIPKLWQ